MGFQGDFMVTEIFYEISWWFNDDLMGFQGDFMVTMRFFMRFHGDLMMI